MLPGRKVTPEDIFGIIRRRVWLLLVPLALVTAGSAVFARMQPRLYRSKSLVLVVPQRVPDSYVRNTVTTQIAERIAAISQQILSRSRLEGLIEEFNLYAAERRTRMLEDVLADMRRDIRVLPERGDAFSVSYTGEDPRTVMRVTDRLTTHFIDEGLKDRQLLADGTNDFLESQLEDARQRLLAHEKKLESYKTRYAGQLPTQVDANVRSMQAIQSQVQSVLDQISRDQDRRLFLERQLADYEQAGNPASISALASTGSAPPLPPLPIDRALPTDPLLNQLQIAQRDLAALVAKGRTPEHPDYKRQQRVVEDLDAQVRAAAAAAPRTAGAPNEPPPVLSGAELARRRRVSEIKDELGVIDKRIGENREKETNLRGTAAEYQRRAEAGPSRESELVELTRDYGTLQNLYTDLLSNKYQAMIAANLEKRQIGERFRLLDPANLPQRPISPNSQQIVSMGLMVGLGLGIALIAFFEYRDRSFKTDDEVASVLALPVLAVVPFMRSKSERRRLHARRLTMHVTMSGAVLACVAVAVYVLLG